MRLYPGFLFHGDCSFLQGEALSFWSEDASIDTLVIWVQSPLWVDSESSFSSKWKFPSLEMYLAPPHAK